MIRIASGQAFWGDWPRAPELQVRAGPIDYLVLDYLAEVTVAILDKQQRRDAEAGYARDFVSDIGALLPEVVDRGIRVVASAGGVNPRGCAEALLEKAEELGVEGLRVGIVEGADVTERVIALVGDRTLETGGRPDPEAGDGPLDLRPLSRDEPPFHEIGSRITSAHAYLGARPIVRALREGPQVVVTGRCTDAALALAPVIHEFDVAPDDWDALALGTVVGHVLECGAHATGGNFLGDWRAVDRAEEIGFPIAEMEGPDRAVITKHESLGGLVNAATVKEQLLYEIGDPRAYMTPDCVADFTSIQLVDLGGHRVAISGVRGSPAPDTLKVTCVYDAGWKVTGRITYCWPEAREKARAAGELVRKRTEAKLARSPFDGWLVELVGSDALFGSRGDADPDPDEVARLVSARSDDREACDHVGRELVGLILTGPPGATGYAAGRPRASKLNGIWSGLVERDRVEPRVEVLG
ncbi:MAG: acyclic terpene utilization AtuA family protein [Longimicrobiales bacterium]